MPTRKARQSAPPTSLADRLGYTHHGVRSALTYAERVVAGEVLACKWVRLACKRALARHRAAARKGYKYFFSEDAAARVCTFIELMPHIKGVWAGTPIRLEPWQCFCICEVFGWLRSKDGLRMVRTVYIEVPRKNAKSTITSAIALYMLTLDGEQGAEVYSTATTRDQAKIVFDTGRHMARKCPEFCAEMGVDVQMFNLNVMETASKFEPLSADAHSLDGLHIHFASVDELHAHKTRAVWDVLETATGSRAQPLIWAITTAGSDRSGICYEQHLYTRKLLQGVFKDDTYFGIIYSIDDEDDWTEPAVWEKANPNYGVSVYPDDMARLARKAMEVSSAVNSFLTKRLNVWVNADTPWMDMRAWDRAGDAGLTLEQFRGRPCIIAVDLASKVDLAAVTLLFYDESTDRFVSFERYYAPEEALEEGENSQYSGWATDGFITATPGNIIDFDFIEQDILDFTKQFEVLELVYDPYQATQFAVHMTQEGLDVVELGATVKNFSEPMKELLALVVSGRYSHSCNPVTTWMASNVVAHTDAKDNIFPRKERPEDKIDGIVAIIMALARHIARLIDPNATVYDKRGIVLA